MGAGRMGRKGCGYEFSQLTDGESKAAHLGRLYTDASKSALFVGLTSLLHIAGADSSAALAILGGLIGGETLGKVLKSLPRGIFTKHN